MIFALLLLVCCLLLVALSTGRRLVAPGEPEPIADQATTAPLGGAPSSHRLIRREPEPPDLPARVAPASK